MHPKKQSCGYLGSRRFYIVMAILLFILILTSSSWWWWSWWTAEELTRATLFELIRKEQRRAHHPTKESGWNPWGVEKEKINLVLVSCGNLKYLVALIKSAILFSRDVQLHFVMVTDEQTMPAMKELIKNALTLANERRLTFELTLARFPAQQELYWRSLYKQCATQRLFLPSLLPHLDSVICIDTDNVIVGNLSSLWSHLYRMDHPQLLAASPDTRTSYHPARGFPYVPPSGINSGVLLMNLTRMRDLNFERQVLEIRERYTVDDSLFDQDLLNILLHNHADWLYALSCGYNFFVGYCNTPEPFCQTELEQEGVFILHGAAGTFQRKRFHSNSLFSLTYKFMETMDLKNSGQDLIATLKARLDDSYLDCYNVLTSERLLQNAVEYVAQPLQLNSTTSRQ